MKWENYVSASENLLSSPQVPSSLEIITLIKKVNPTRLTLLETDRERGYQLKNRLQSLLLEHYGDTFQLIPHPASPNIILIKHRVLPSIDACHADLASLSSEAIERVETAAALHPVREELKRNREKGPRETGVALSPKKALKKAQALLEEYDYAAAEEILAGLHAHGSDDLWVIQRAAAILLHEIGAYQRCIDTLLSQPKNVLKDRGIREMLAVAYHHNGSLPEARAILDELYPAELGLEALFAYADVAFKDGNLSAALDLVQIAKGREGFFSGLDSLQKEIETAMLAQAEPVVQKAQAALQSAAIEEAGQLARTDTALIVLGDGRQAFFNLSNNKFSSKIRVGRVIPSHEDGKWYCFDYSRKDRTLWLRDITREIHNKLEWREFFSLREKPKKREKLMLWFNNHDNFVYRPGEWGASESAGFDEAGSGSTL